MNKTRKALTREMLSVQLLVRGELGTIRDNPRIDGASKATPSRAAVKVEDKPPAFLAHLPTAEGVGLARVVSLLAHGPRGQRVTGPPFPGEPSTGVSRSLKPCKGANRSILQDGVNGSTDAAGVEQSAKVRWADFMEAK